MSSSERRANAFVGYCLLVSSGGRQKRFQLRAGENLIGSRSSNQIPLRESGVSREHAVLDVGIKSVTLRDLKSKNGTFLNGKTVRSVAVKPGDVIELGKARLWVEEVDPGDAELGLTLSPVVRRSPRGGFASRDTTRIGIGARSRRPATWPIWFEGLVECLCLFPSDIHGTLLLLLRELGLQKGALVELPEAGGARVLSSVGGMEGALLEEGLESCSDHLGRFSEGRRPDCSSFRASGRLEMCGSVLLGSEPVLGLLVMAREPIAESVEPVLRVVLRLIDRLGARARSAPRPSVEPAKPPGLVFPADYLPGESPVMASLYAQMLPLLEGDLPILIVGETGVGKEYLAKILHESSARRDEPFVAINCAAIPGDLLEAELFGIEEGVATGVSGRAGKFSLAHGGTLFLDEIGDLAAHLQAKLLRALQEGEIHPVGGTPTSVDVRVLSSTNTDLKAKAEGGRFRLDLYYRLAGYTLIIPPLRERREDISGLVQHFVQRSSREIDKSIRGVTVKVLRMLREYEWPGNIRELENEISRMVYACEESQAIESTLLSPYLSEESGVGGNAALNPLSVQDSPTLNLAEIEKRAIERALEASQRKLISAAGMLGISRDALRRRMGRHGLLGQ